MYLTAISTNNRDNHTVANKTSRMISSRIILLLTLLGFVTLTHSADTPFEFERLDEEQKYKELVSEIRCLVCQNQSLADSHAGLAQDLRNEIYHMVREGTAKKDIIAFLVARYGDFVLYRPPLKSTTLLLWFGPFLILLVAALAAFILVKNRAAKEVTELDSDQQEKIRLLLDDDAAGKDK